MKALFQFRTFFRSESAIPGVIVIMIFTCFQCTSDPQNRPSPLRVDTTSIGGVDVSIEFSSPGVKNREIFGIGPDYLVPYNELWRTGANHATYISITDHMYIDSLKLDSGSYSIFTIPNENEWMVIFNSEWNQWGSYSYKDSLDVLRLNVKPKYADQSQERMLFYFADDSLKFRWDQVRWAIPITSRPLTPR